MYLLFIMPATLSKAAERAMKILKWTYIPGISKRYALTVDGVLVLKEHLFDEQLYYHDYQAFRMNPQSIQYSQSVLKVIQNKLIRLIPKYNPKNSLAPLILKFLNKEFPRVKMFTDAHIHYAYEIYETCVEIERERRIRKWSKHDNL